eukprot:Gregarina_sp_Poly_1__743@NODE_1178_length_4857_cov_128_051148_g808_i0_p1_GENE_NODE_1178_length_4857_cov_128_051148_g808_i0NODE_1178_length_4857_cov_128_051148_g808_i0_p1_ORF_typecomplete_len306_score2_52DUF3522/PF12036_8/5_6e08_NODE_1178_length_4857_cov_128_051148_g808_i022503167
MLYFDCVTERIHMNHYLMTQDPKSTLLAITSSCTRLIRTTVIRPPIAAIELYRHPQSLEIEEIPPVDYDDRFRLLQFLDFYFAFFTLLYVVVLCSHLPFIISATTLVWAGESLRWGFTTYGAASVEVILLSCRLSGILLIISSAGICYKLMYSRRAQPSQSTSIVQMVGNAIFIDSISRIPNIISNQHRTLLDPSPMSLEPRSSITTNQYCRSIVMTFLDKFCSTGWPQLSTLIPAGFLLCFATVAWILANMPRLRRDYWFWHSLWHLCIESLPGLIVHACYGKCSLWQVWMGQRKNEDEGHIER